MSEIDAELVRRLVTRRKNDGRAVYDPQAEAEVVPGLHEPGVSVAVMALRYGINANLLRRRISQSKQSDGPEPSLALGVDSNGCQSFPQSLIPRRKPWALVFRL